VQLLLERQHQQRAQRPVHLRLHDACGTQSQPSYECACVRCKRTLGVDSDSSARATSRRAGWYEAHAPFSRLLAFGIAVRV
jgi:hypothetical protein